VLRTEGQGYLLAVEPETVDAVRFERLACAGREALASDPADAADKLRAALELWRGEPLAEFGFELFAQAEIARLTELRITTVEDRAEADLALGRHGALCGELSQAVTEQPLRERLWSQLIRALYRCGRQADALSAYTRLRDQLAELLGIDPSPELVKLNEAVLTQCPDLDWQPQAAPRTERLPSTPAAQTPSDKLLPEARGALAAHDWESAFDLFSRAERSAALRAEDLDGMAEAAYWLGFDRDALSIRQRAHHVHLQGGDHRQAAVDAVILTVQHTGLRHYAVARGWFQRAQRLLENEPACVEHGYLAWGATLVGLMTDDPEMTLESARSAYELGVRHGVAELQALGLVFQGAVVIRRGQVAEGLALQDEGMVMAVGGGLSQLATVQIFCQVVRTCCELHEYRRAQEWTDAIEDCFVRTGLTSFPGDCEAHRVTVMTSRGAWVLAEQLAHQACARAQCFDPVHAGAAFAGIGDIRLRIGDLATAEEAYDKAEELGADALPGRARLKLLRGQPAEAAPLINTAVAGDRWDRLDRTRLLPDQVTIALAVGDLDTARAAAAEQAELAEIFGGAALRAAAECARGEVALATGDEDPVPALRRGVALWREAGAPYEGARSRVLLATGLCQAGQTEAAQFEMDTARACFDRLGARLDAVGAAEPVAVG
jgi:tetratricopeptide (TPR) repeat protein